MTRLLPKYNFKEQLAVGAAGEHALDPILRKVYNPLRSATRAEEFQGIDRVGVYPPTKCQHTIQIKTDWKAAKTGNAFIETVSEDNREKPGWAYTCQADLLIYFLPQIPRIYCILPRELRQKLPEWQERYQTGTAINERWQTIGLKVPLLEFQKIAVVVSKK